MNVDDTTPPRADRLAKHVLFWALLLLPVLVLALWWAGGLRIQKSSVVGFDNRLVRFDFVDTPLEKVLTVLYPKSAVRFNDSSANILVTLSVRGMSERDAFIWIAEECATNIVMKDDHIEVEQLPWLERSYRWVNQWTQRYGLHVWPNR